MARVRIHRLEAHVHSREAARKLIKRVTYQIQFRARVTVLTGPYTTGKLAASITSDIVTTPNGVRGRVGSRLIYAASVQSGARRHKIYPHNPPYHLKFFWRKVGHTVWLKSVNHPGQKGKHYLTAPLAEIARINHMRYVIYER